jgi:putative restriction endonuclease
LTSANHPGAHLGRRATSHLSEPRLVDVARIFIDADERLEQPVISHGLPLTKIHHVAFDAHLIGVDPDYRIDLSDRLLEIHDGPLKGIAGTLIVRPNRIEDRPERDRLAIRFEQKAA